MSPNKLIYMAALLLTATFARAADQRSQPAPEGRVQIALLLDTSNSMDGLINQAKATLWDIVNEFTYVRCREAREPRLEIALYEYGNDGLDAGEGYIRQVLPFSNDLDEISERLFSLSTNGGEEYCGQVIRTALRQLKWSPEPGDLRFVFIAGNEPFNQGRVAYESVMSDTAEKDVVVNTIFCGDYHLGVNTLWADGARRGGGEYTAIDHNREIVHIVTPYDDVIIQLNTALNNTYIGYGSRGRAKKQQQSAQDNNAMEMEEAVMVERAVSKSSGYYQNSSWDLVDAYAENKVELDKLDRAALPAPLQDLDEDGLQAHLEKQLQQRKRIQTEIQEANRKRETYLAEHRSAEEVNLQSALLAAVKKQAERKSFRWVEK